MYTKYIETGFPSPAQGYEQPGIDLAAYLVPHQASTFFMKIATDRYRALDIRCGDIIVIDRSLQPAPGSCVVAGTPHGFTCVPFPFVSPASTEITIFGVITFVVHSLKKQ